MIAEAKVSSRARFAEGHRHKDSVGGVHTRRGSQLVGDARGVLWLSQKTAPSRGKYHTRNSDGKPRNDIAKVARTTVRRLPGRLRLWRGRMRGVTRPHHSSRFILDP